MIVQYIFLLQGIRLEKKILHQADIYSIYVVRQEQELFLFYLVLRQVQKFHYNQLQIVKSNLSRLILPCIFVLSHLDFGLFCTPISHQ